MTSPGPRAISLISVPYHAGTPGIARALGPAALLESHGLAGGLGEAVAVELIAAPDPRRPEIARTFDIARAIAERVGAARSAERLPLVLAGDCNSCLGTVAGLDGGPLGVVWFDAHGDFDTTADNASGSLDVMGLSTLTGSCWHALRRSIPGFHEVAERDVILAGVRDLEPYQRARLDGSRVRALYGDALRSGSIEALLVPALDALRARAPEIYLHVDLDVLDPSEGRANEYAAPGGLSLAKLERAIGLVGSRLGIAGAAITAYDPAYDPAGTIARAAVRVARAIRAAAGA